MERCCMMTSHIATHVDIYMSMMGLFPHDPCEMRAILKHLLQTYASITCCKSMLPIPAATTIEHAFNVHVPSYVLDNNVRTP